MMGLHPTSVKEDYKIQLESIYKELWSSKAYVAVGEIGIDLYRDTMYIEEQTEAFEIQLSWSKKRNLPISIHSRNSYKEIIDSLRRVGEKNLRGVFHSFNGNDEDLKELLKLDNFFFGINGIVTFKNSTLSTVLKNCPIEKIVLETDSPYLAPAPYRGKRNEPQYLKHINNTLSEIYDKEPNEIAQITNVNAKQLFGLSV
ncbi:MAG TPA: TatD family hydrolase [Dysgonamonadaceae bacterium]|nr:TatD family hydrolase [Dysgonamonadaceae bacterium]